MKKVLFGASVYQHLASFHKPFMKWFQEVGYEVHAIGNDSLGRKYELLEMGVICHDVDFDRSPLSKKNFKAINQLKHLFSSHFFDLIHVHTPTAAFLTRYAAQKHQQGKIVYTAHGFHFFKGGTIKNWLLFYPAEKIATKWTNTLIVMNNEDYSSGEKLGFQKNKNLFNVNGVGVDLTEFVIDNSSEYLKIELELNEKAVVIVCIAELSSRKNQIFLLNSWNDIIKQVPNAHLVFVGKGPDEDMLKKFIQKNNLINIHLLGYRKDVPQIIASADIVTLVSKQEGLPRCLMEGMAVGKPIICTDIRGSADLVVDRNTGFVIELDNQKMLSDQMIKLILDEELRKEFGENAKVRIQDYSIDQVMRDMKKIYSNILNQYE